MATTHFLDVEKLVPEATMPEMHCPMASAYNIFASETVLMDVGEKKFINTGISIKVPCGYYGQIVGRQAMMAIGADVANSIIDPHTNLPLRILIINNSFHELPIMRGDKIAALLIMPCDQLLIRRVVEQPLDLSI